MRIERRSTAKGEERWCAVVRRAGAPTTSRTFTRRRDAEEWGVDQERRILRERAGLSAPTSRAALADLVERYHRASHPHPEDSGRDRRRHLDWWVEQLGREPAAGLRPRRIRDALSTLSRTLYDAEGREYEQEASPATRNRYLSSLSALYRWAQEADLLEANPALAVRRSAERTRMVRYLTDDERTALLAACRDQGPLLYAMVLVSLWTGGRRGEVLQLRWRAIDWQRNLVLYPATKGGNPRTVPGPPEMFDALRELGPDAPDEPVFGDWRFWPRRPWRKALEASGVGRFRWHDLRHSCASWLVQHGVPIADVQQMLGHRSIQTSLRYAHLAPSDAHERVRAALSQHAGAPPSPGPG